MAWQKKSRINAVLHMLVLFLMLNNLNFLCNRVLYYGSKLYITSHHKNRTIFANNIFVQLSKLLDGLSLSMVLWTVGAAGSI